MFINGYLQNNNTSAVSLFNSPYVYTYGIEVYTDIGIDMHTNIYIYRYTYTCAQLVYTFRFCTHTCRKNLCRTNL